MFAFGVVLFALALVLSVAWHEWATCGGAGHRDEGPALLSASAHTVVGAAG